MSTDRAIDEERRLFAEALGLAECAGRYLVIYTRPDEVNRWATSEQQALDILSRLNGKLNVYVGVGLRDRDHGRKKRGGVVDVSGMFGMWADIDVAGPGHSENKVYSPGTEDARALAEHDLPPTLLVDSGHGLQAWWLFEEPWLFSADYPEVREAERKQARTLAYQWSRRLKALAQERGWDLDSVFDLARVMRWPGTTNTKPGLPPVPVRLLSADGPRYQLADFRQVLADAPQPPPDVYVEVDELVVDPNANPPALKLADLVHGKPYVPSLLTHTDNNSARGDKSQNTYDWSLAHAAVEAGWSDQEVADFLIMARREAKEKPKSNPAYYLARTIAKVRAEQGQHGVPAPEGETPDTSESDRKTDVYNLAPLDWQALIRDGIPQVEFISEPYFPKLARIWIWGQTGAYKSLWCAWVAAGLSRQGIRVSYFSEENPVGEELRRLSKLQPDPAFYRLFHRTGMDLIAPKWVAALLDITRGDDVIFLDSWTDLWTGDEGDNRAVQQFDATVLKPLQAQGVTPVVMHHVGHKNMFSDRAGATAGRGASSLGQKADITLELKVAGEDRFSIVYGKARIGGIRQPERGFQVIDTEDGRIEIVEAGSPEENAVRETQDKMVAFIDTAGRPVTTTELRAAVGGRKNRQSAALELLEQDARTETNVERIQTRDGKYRSAKVWRTRRVLGDGLHADADGGRSESTHPCIGDGMGYPLQPGTVQPIPPDRGGVGDILEDAPPPRVTL